MSTQQTTDVVETSFTAGSAGTVDALLLRPQDAHALYVFAHGAGAPMRHHFMHDFAQVLARRGVATFRYNFPYAQKGRRAPDRPAVLEETVRAAIDAAHAAAPELPLIAGGKSMGGRMTSQTLATAPHDHVRGIVFVGFPLHPAGKPDDRRADHLPAVTVPMLFLQGTRDSLADLERMKTVTERLGDTATLHIVDGADHGFHVLKSTGRTDADVMDEMADRIVNWLNDIVREA